MAKATSRHSGSAARRRNASSQVSQASSQVSRASQAVPHDDVPADETADERENAGRDEEGESMAGLDDKDQDSDQGMENDDDREMAIEKADDEALMVEPAGGSAALALPSGRAAARRATRPAPARTGPPEFILANPVTRFVYESYVELRKVTWPRSSEAWNMTLVVILMSAFVAALLGLADLGLQRALAFLVSLSTGHPH
jgi:preprotein translocase SecE subunit